jgi:hypothetical protein
MTQTEINAVKQGTEAVLLSNNQFANIRHEDLAWVVNITWKQQERELKLSKVHNKEFITQYPPSDLAVKNILVLNAEQEGQERFFKLELFKLRLKLTEIPTDQEGEKIKIIDKQ